MNIREENNVYIAIIITSLTVNATVVCTISITSVFVSFIHSRLIMNIIVKSVYWMMKSWRPS